MNSGGTIGSGAPASAAVGVPTAGTISELSKRAAMLLAACLTCLDADGTICATIDELAVRSTLSPRGCNRAFAELRAVGLVHVRGAGAGLYRYIEPRIVRLLRQQRAKPASAGWREMRAKAGGHERAMRAALTQRDIALQQLEEARSRPSAPETSAPVIAWLLAELEHATDCLDVDCERCAGTSRRLEDPPDEVARDLVSQHLALLSAARAVCTAAADHDRAALARGLDALRRAAR